LSACPASPCCPRVCACLLTPLSASFCPCLACASPVAISNDMGCVDAPLGIPSGLAKLCPGGKCHCGVREHCARRCPLPGAASVDWAIGNAECFPSKRARLLHVCLPRCLSAPCSRMHHLACAFTHFCPRRRRLRGLGGTTAALPRHCGRLPRWHEVLRRVITRPPLYTTATAPV